MTVEAAGSALANTKPDASSRVSLISRFALKPAGSAVRLRVPAPDSIRNTSISEAFPITPLVPKLRGAPSGVAVAGALP